MGDGSSGSVLSESIDVLDGLLVEEVENPKFGSVPEVPGNRLSLSKKAFVTFLFK